MIFAFHFSDDGQGWRRYDEAFLRLLLSLPGQRVHTRVHRGNVVSWDFPSNPRERQAVIGRLLEGSWTTFTEDSFHEMLVSAKPYVLMATSLTRNEGVQLALALQRHSDYLGAVELDNRRGVHWAIYDQRLLHTYRVVGKELRLLYGDDEAAPEDNRDHEALKFWRRFGLFTAVEWERVGVRATIFDEFDTPTVAARTGETLVLAVDHFEKVATEVVSRTFDLDPKLVETLHAALTALQRAETGEQLAHAALSCRRFLERLADVLFPPRKGGRDGHKLGRAEWKNRLWAYAEDALGSGQQQPDLLLDEVGERIDRTVKAAQSGVHSQESTQVAVQRLVLGVLSLTYDLLVLRPPPLELPDAPYNEGAIRVIRELLTR